MTNLFERSIDLGVGLFMYSKEKIEEMVEDLVSKGEISKKDARQFAGELIKRGQEQREEMQKLVSGEIARALDHVNVARKEDIVTRDEISRIVREQLLQVLQEQGIVKKEV